jgi:hypothetical protein
MPRSMLFVSGLRNFGVGAVGAAGLEAVKE